MSSRTPRPSAYVIVSVGPHDIAFVGGLDRPQRLWATTNTDEVERLTADEATATATYLNLFAQPCRHDHRTYSTLEVA